MVSHKRKALISLLALDVIVTALFAVSDSARYALSSWVFLNVLVITLALIIRHLLSIGRKSRGQDARQRWKRRRIHYRRRKRAKYRTQYSYVDNDNFKKPFEQQYGIKSITLKGEEADSKEEKIVADYLFLKGIQYECHKPIFADEYHSRILAVPDFYLPDYHVYVEYWGLETVPNTSDRERYNRRKDEKICIYSHINTPLISIHKWELNSLHSVFPDKFRKVTGHDLNQNQERLF